MEFKIIGWVNMINIDNEDLDDETFENKMLEKADYIGEVLIGERKIKLQLPKRKPQLTKPKPKKLSVIQLFINNIKQSFKKYREITLARLLGLSIIIIIIISILTISIYLLYLLLMELAKIGIVGIIGFTIFMCALSLSTIILIASRYTQK
jgi:hypothetical protein